MAPSLNPVSTLFGIGCDDRSERVETSGALVRRIYTLCKCQTKINTLGRDTCHAKVPSTPRYKVLTQQRQLICELMTRRYARISVNQLHRAPTGHHQPNDYARVRPDT